MPTPAYPGRRREMVAPRVGLITGLGTIGIDVSALVAGLGLRVWRSASHLKDVVSNSIAGIMILIYKPFGRHDRISRHRS